MQAEHATYSSIKQAITNPKSDIRTYFTGDVLGSLKLLMEKAAANANATLKMAIYELDDTELVGEIIANKTKVEIVLSNTSANTAGEWDTENSPARTQL